MEQEENRRLLLACRCIKRFVVKILFQHFIQGRKKINVVFKDLFSWVIRKLEFFLRNMLFSHEIFF